jgi:hypothetical protein
MDGARVIEITRRPPRTSLRRAQRVRRRPVRSTEAGVDRMLAEFA